MPRVTFHDSPFGGNPFGQQSPNPFAAHDTFGQQQPFAPASGVPVPASRFADVTRGDRILDVVAAVLLAVALTVPWNRGFALPEFAWHDSGASDAVTAAILIATACSLVSVLASYTARLGLFGSAWTHKGVRRFRVIANVPLFLVAVGFVGNDVVRKFLHVGAVADLADYPGVGAGVWCAVAGAVLAAQPRHAERIERSADWTGESLALMRFAWGLSAFSLAAVVLGAVSATESAAVGPRLGYTAVVGLAGLVAVITVATAAIGLRHDFPGWRVTVGAFAATTLVIGLFLSFGEDIVEGGSERATEEQARSISGTAIPPQPTIDVPVMVVLDVSGSMLDVASDGTSRIDSARDSVDALIDGLDRGRQFGMVVFPATGGEESDCTEGRVAIPLGDLDANEAHSVVADVEAYGGTPTGPALRQAAQIIHDEAGSGMIVLVSDGASSCDTDPPCPVAQKFAADGIDVTVNAVGFEISDIGAGELGCIANSTGGEYILVSDATQLRGAISDLSRTSTRNVSASWLELFHGDGGYYALTFWIAAGAAVLFARGRETDQIRPAGYAWLSGCRHLLTLIAIWSLGYGIVGVVTAMLGLNVRTVGESIAIGVLLALSGITAAFGSSALRTDSGFAQESATDADSFLPSREIAVSACAGLLLISIARIVVAARPAVNPPPSVLDCVMVALPATIALILLIAPPIRRLYRTPVQDRTRDTPSDPFAPFTEPTLASTAAVSTANPFMMTQSAGPFGGFSSPSPEVPRADADAAAVANRATTPNELFRLAQTRPDLRSRIAKHPNAYPGLKDWIRQQR